MNHLYVLIPVLDSEKHYFVGEEEIDKLLRRGQEWLSDHPDRDFIARRYLRNKKSLAAIALERLLAEEEAIREAEDLEIVSSDGSTDIPKTLQQNCEEVLEEKISLNERRMESVIEKLKELGIRRVIDLGCGEGKLLRHLLEDYFFTKITGTDVSIRSLEIASRRLRIERLPERKKERIELFQGSLMYSDKRLDGFDGATCIEVIEHLDLPRLRAFEKVVFHAAKPPVVIITTPNCEYNQLFEGMELGQFRHRDHRFEWTRKEFADWTDQVCKNYGYQSEIFPVGDVDATHGAPTQMGVFKYGN